MSKISPDLQDSLQRTLDLLLAALSTLDEASAPPDLGAHVDLAVERVRARLEGADVIRRRLFH